MCGFISALTENKVPSKGDQDRSGLDDRKIKFVARELLNVRSLGL